MPESKVIALLKNRNIIQAQTKRTKPQIVESILPFNNCVPFWKSLIFWVSQALAEANIKMKLNLQGFYWCKHSWERKWEGSWRRQGESSENNASRTLNWIKEKKNERLGRNILDCHAVLGRFGKSSSQSWLLGESHVSQEKVLSTTAASSSWDEALGKMCNNRFHSPVAWALGYTSWVWRSSKFYSHSYHFS